MKLDFGEERDSSDRGSGHLCIEKDDKDKLSRKKSSYKRFKSSKTEQNNYKSNEGE